MDSPSATTFDRTNNPVPYADHHSIDRLCLDALRREALAWPKPGLVTPLDAGSHRDMHIGTFLAGIAALEGTFARLASSAACGEDLPALQVIGREAEQRMLAATGGVNTHRGAIHNLGFLTVAAVLRRGDPALAGLTCGAVVAREWGERISASRTCSPDTNGNRVFRRFAVGGARGEAASGFPTVYRIGVPTLRRLLEAGHNHETALIGTLLALIEHLDDTNLLWRGGEAGLAFARESAGIFNANGGVGQPCWRELLVVMHREFVARNLSPGGSADLVAASWVVHHLDTDGFV